VQANKTKFGAVDVQNKSPVSSHIRSVGSQQYMGAGNGVMRAEQLITVVQQTS
jgi:hypothetical protein